MFSDRHDGDFRYFYCQGQVLHLPVHVLSYIFVPQSNPSTNFGAYEKRTRHRNFQRSKEKKKIILFPLTSSVYK